ncbi:helix-turn-helix transcriptional regulator [Methylobacillus rhizosphaerae]|nr:LuxR C-terminal-related transcriptional regulator [Methylobacillus rhizosphaerae]
MAFSTEETLIGDLYQAALKEPAASFQQRALQMLGRSIGFDQAWWGILSPNSHGFSLRSSFRHELPLAFEEHWKLVSADDTLASDVHRAPKTTIHYTPADLSSTPGLKSLNGEQGIQHALCTSIFLPGQDAFFFITLFRSGQYAQPFTPHAISLKQQLTSHIYLSWKANLEAEIERMHIPNMLLKASTAFIDDTGLILCADSAFADMFRELCPKWRTPDHIALNLLNSASMSANGQFQIRSSLAGGLQRLDISRDLIFNRLTAREKEIALLYADGKSYKDIAFDLALSPTTVRHYLRLIYAKAEITDKSELVRLSDEYSSMLTMKEMTGAAEKASEFLLSRM